MEIHLKDIIFQIINFGILLFVLTKFLYKPILKVLDERASKIKEGLEAAEKNVKLQSEGEGEKKQIVSTAKKEADVIVKEAKKEAEGIIADAKSKAKKEAKAIADKEKAAGLAQLDQQRQDLEKNLSALVLKATEQVLKDTIDVKLQKALIDKQIKSLSKTSFTS